MLKNVFMKVFSCAITMTVAVSIPAMTVLAEDTTNGSETNSPVEIETNIDGALKVSDSGNYTYNQDLDFEATNPGYAVMVTGSATSAFEGYKDADNSDLTLTINGEVNATQGNEQASTAIAYVNDGTLNINDNATSEGEGLNAYGGDINIKGDLTIDSDDTNNTAIISNNNSNINITGDVTKNGPGVYAISQSSGNTNIGGDVNVVDGRAILVSDSGKINVAGSVIANDTALTVTGGSTATVGKNVVSLSGIYEPAVRVDSSSNLIIGGDLNANYRPLWITITEGGNGTIDIKGTINGNTGIQLRQSLYGFNKGMYDWEALTDEDKQNLIAFLPRVNVYSINSNGEFLVPSESVSKDVYEVFYNNINYYINADENVTINSENKQTMRTIDTLNVSVPEGYTLQVSDTMSFTQLEDGTYAVKLNSYRGNIDIKAIIKAISQATGIAEEDIKVVTENNEIDNTPAPSSGMGISVSTPSTNPDAFAPVIEGGATPSKAIKFDFRNGITNEAYKTAVIESFKSTPAGTTLRIESNTTSVFDKKMIEALAANPTIDVEVLFTYAGKKMRVVIPAGYDVNSLLDSNGYCGYLRLASILGAQIIDI